MKGREESDINRKSEDVTARKTLDREVSKDRKMTVPVVEEELAVGKRTVETGGVRVEKEVTAKPVEEDIRLREEHVTVDRRPVDREVRPDDLRAFENQSIEMRERSEEAVVSKQARVVEEVTVGKETREHTEHISDTVRRTDVRIEPIRGGNETRRGFDAIDGACRTHYKQQFANSGWDYDTGYSHAYRYGYDLAGSGRDWNTIEPDVRKDWETRNKGTWESFKDAIRYGFGQGRG